MRLFLLFILLSVAINTSAQHRLGLEFGANANIWTSPGTYMSAKHSSDARPMVSLYYLRKIGGHVALGAKLSIEGYRFYYSLTDLEKSLRTDVSHNSSFITVAPTVDVGLGRTQVLHFYVSIPVGFNTSADQVTTLFQSGNITNPAIASITNTTADITKTFVRPTIGLKQHIPLMKKWQFTFNEGIGFLVNDLSLVNKTNGISPGYLTLQMGIMRKFKRPKLM